jgi:uncharacterized protein YebE (UPF0316 family)
MKFYQAVYYLTLILIIPLALGNCSGLKIKGENGETHYLILGLGVVTTNDNKENAIIATDSHSLGLIISNRPGVKLGLGYSESTVVTVQPGAKDVRAEISKKPGGPLIVDVPSAIMNKSNISIKGGENE